MEPESSPIDILAVQPLKLFNKQKVLADLWDLKQDGVLAFFDDINKHQQTYGIKDDLVKKKFPDVVKRISTIVKGKKGPIFLDPTMELPFLDITLEVRNLYDLVGWIFSVSAGKIAKEANRNNFYLPLICVYCLFCRRLTENMDDPKAQFADLDPMDYDPTMTQITWFNNPDDNEIYFSLSANLDCWTLASREAYKKKKGEVRHDRAVQLQQIGILGSGVKVDDRPENGTNLYGMCAETVPFLFIKSIMKRKTKVPFKPELVEGFAFQGFKILPEKPGEKPKAYNSDTIKGEGPCREPCPTCQLLINSQQLKFHLANFTNTF